MCANQCNSCTTERNSTQVNVTNATWRTQVLRCPCCLHHQQDEDKCPGGEKGHGDFIPTPSGHSPSLRLGKARGGAHEYCWHGKYLWDSGKYGWYFEINSGNKSFYPCTIILFLSWYFWDLQISDKWKTDKLINITGSEYLLALGLLHTANAAWYNVTFEDPLILEMLFDTCISHVFRM